MEGKKYAAVISAALALAALSVASPVSAQSWAVVRSGVGEGTDAERAARAGLIDALRATGLELRPDADAVARVEDYHSTEPSVVESDRIDELRAAVTALEEHAALRHRDAARREAERIRELSGGLSDALAEQSEVAERLFAACVAEAWLHVQLREREEARHTLEQCRELHPDVAINPLTVAPPIVEMLATIDAELARRPTFALTCEGVPDGCELRMDGRRRAAAPEPIAGIVAGAHRVEIVCAGMRRRRVHRVVIAEDRTVAFDPGFDDVLRTRPPPGGAPEVRLDYASEAEQRQRYVDDGVTVAGVLEATLIVLATPEARGLRFDRIEVDSRRVTASVIVDPANFQGVPIARAATALIERRSVDLTGPEPRTIRTYAPSDGGEADLVADAPDETPDRPSDGGPGIDAAPIVGGVMAVLGVGAVGVAWAAYGVAQDAGWAMINNSNPRDPEWAANRSSREGSMNASYGLVIGGSVLTTASLPLFLPQTPGEVPWWSLVIGGVGVGVLVPAFIYLPANGIRYAEGALSYARYDTELSGTMFIAMAAPLLAVPLIYLIRLVTNPAVAASASIDLGPDHAIARVGGSF